MRRGTEVLQGCTHTAGRHLDKHLFLLQPQSAGLLCRKNCSTVGLFNIREIFHQIHTLVYLSFSLLVQSSLLLETASPTWTPLPPSPFLPSVPFSKTEVCVCVCVCVRASVCMHAQSCPTLCNPMNYSPPASSVHGILQARILEWVDMLSCRGSSRPGDQTHVSCVSCVSCIAVGFFTTESLGKPKLK